MQEQLKNGAEEIYFQERSDYREEIKKKNSATANLEKLKYDKERASIMDLICQTYIQAQNQLLNKVRIATTIYHAIATKLRTTATVVTTGEEISDPLGNLS